jgi:hypothetical protein
MHGVHLRKLQPEPTLMSHHLELQRQRCNESRRRNGQAPYADVREYLIDQGFSEAKASTLAAGAGAASPDIDPGETGALDPGQIYARANRTYRESIHSCRAPGARSDDEDKPDSPADGATAPADASTFEAIAIAAYAGRINATYRRAIGEHQSRPGA